MYAKRILALCAALLLGSPILAQEIVSPPDEHVVIPCSPCDTCGRPAWASIDYLVGWFPSANLPPLITTSAPGTVQANAGVLGAPSTRALFDGEVNDGARSGIRLAGGYPISADGRLALEGGFMMVESEATNFSASSTGNPILARPFTNAVTNAQQSVLIAFPGNSSGAVDVRAASGNFYEGHVGLSETQFDSGWFRLDSILGYRFYRYDEGLRFRQLISPTNPNFAPGTRIATADDFQTQNQFHGVDLGLRGEMVFDRLSLEVLAKIALGRIYRETEIQGSQIVSAPGAATVARNAGVYALQSNIGNHFRDDWAAFPQIGVSLNYHVNSNLRLRLGYFIFLLDGIARADDQVDQTIDPALFPPAGAPGAAPARPLIRLEQDDSWVQFLSLGAVFVY